MQAFKEIKISRYYEVPAARDFPRYKYSQMKPPFDLFMK